MSKIPHSITVISSPYHVGVRGLSVGAGPLRLQSLGLISVLESLSVEVHQTELEPVDDFDGEIGRSFELFRRTSVAVTSACDAGSFPILLSGNCSASVGVWAGLHAASQYELNTSSLGCIWFDAHDDFNTPDTTVSGYFDSMPLSMMSGMSWKALVESIPGFTPLELDRLIHVGMRDVSDVEHARVMKAGFDVVWGSAERKVDYRAELDRKLMRGAMDAAMVHVDLDSLDVSVGRASKFAAPGGLSVEDLVGCLEGIPDKALPVSLTVASYDPSYDSDDRMGNVAIHVISSFVNTLLRMGLLVPEAGLESTTKIAPEPLD